MSTPAMQTPLVAPCDDSMLLVLPVPFHRRHGALYFEQQACNGLRRWGEHFSHVTVAAPEYPDAVAQADSSTLWSPVTGLDASHFTFVPLPWGYGYRAFFRSLPAVHRLLREHMARNTYLHFAIGYLIGDWAAVAALEAARQGRSFALHTDRVEHQVILEVAKAAPLARRLYARLIAAAVRRYHRYLIRRCTLGLWHGADCYDEYSRWCRQSHLIHDVHCASTDAIDELALRNKLQDAAQSPRLRVCYAGRMEAMKGPSDWLQAIAVARDLGAPIDAVWYGEGSLRAQMQEQIEKLQLGAVVRLPGLIPDRNELLGALRSAHLLLFTHLTRESPRCLLEALLCGTPLMGYHSRFAQELTATRGGGLYCELYDWRTLGRHLSALAADRTRLCRMIREAAINGRRFNDVSVFAERSALIKRYCLSAGTRAGTLS